MKKFHQFFLAAYKYIIIIAVLVLVFFVIRKLNSGGEETQAEFKTEQAEEQQPIAVGAAKAFRGDLVIRVTSTGLARAAAVIELAPEVSGRVTQVLAREGDYVRKGDPVFRIDATRYQLALDDAADNVKSAQAVFVDQLFTKYDTSSASGFRQANPRLWYEDENEASFQRARELYSRGAISKEDFEEAELFYRTAKDFAGQNREDRVIVRSGLSRALIARKRARLDLEATVVRAPFSGILGDQDVCVGQYVTAGRACYKLVDLSTVNVSAGCLESEVKDIRTGSRAGVSFSAFPGEAFSGRVISVNPLVDPESKTCRVTVAVPNPDSRIKAGMFAFVKLEAATLADKLLVPREAVLVRNERDLLFIVRDDKAVWSYVELGRGNEDYYEILSSAYDLKAGEPVLTDNHYTMFHDAPVAISGQ